MESLYDLYSNHTGKVSDKWMSNILLYDELFSTKREKPITLLEIGIQNGGSLEIWAKYFSNAENIVGCDINQKCSELTYEDERVIIHVGDVTLSETRDRVAELCSEFDIIIDDGSHRSGDIIKTFASYFPLLSLGGLYIVEDLHCSYWQSYDGGVEDPASSLSFFRRLTDFVNKESWGGDGASSDLLAFFVQRYGSQFSETCLEQIRRVLFQNSLVAIWKAERAQTLLGPRMIAGTVADISQDVVGLGGTLLSCPQQAVNPFGPRAIRRETAISRYVATHVPDDFDPLAYLDLHPDVRNAGVDPVQHYLTFGKMEGRAYRK